MGDRDIIVDIPPERVRFFGGNGKMLLPSVTTLMLLIASIPPQQVLTTDQIRKHLTKRYNVRGTCPVTTQKALKTLIEVVGPNIPCWRVTKKNGELLASFPGGTETHAALLAAEGYHIDHSGKAPRLCDLESCQMKLDA